MSAMTATLARCSDEEDVVVGTALVNRHLIELEGSVGCYINLIPVRTDLRADPTLAELLRAVRGSVIRGLGHQATPFEEIADLAGAPRDLRRNPVFQTLLVMGEGAGPPSGRRTSPWRHGNSTSPPPAPGSTSPSS